MGDLRILFGSISDIRSHITTYIGRFGRYIGIEGDGVGRYQTIFAFLGIVTYLKLGAGTGGGYFHIKYGRGIGRYDLVVYIAGIDDGIF